jgi:para-nitrobenzyl esterase
MESSLSRGFHMRLPPLETFAGDHPSPRPPTEIPFVFDTVEARYGEDLTPADKATASTANAYWVNFARTGNPKGSGLPDWPVIGATGDTVLDFTLKGPVGGPDSWKVRLDLIERLVGRSK